MAQPKSRGRQPKQRRNRVRWEAGGFSASTVVGLRAWWDFADGNTLFTDAGTTKVSADGQAIYQANDKSGNAFHLTQGTAGRRPTYKVGILNGRSVARFAGVTGIESSWMQSTAADMTQPYTIMCVFMTTDVSAFNRYVTDGDAQNQGVIQTLNTGKLRLYAGGIGDTDATMTASTYYVTTHVFNAINSKVGWGGALKTVDGGVQSTTGVTLGLDGGLNQNGHLGDVCEVLYFDSALGAADMNIVGNYLASKWGLTWTAV